MLSLVHLRADLDVLPNWPYIRMFGMHIPSFGRKIVQAKLQFHRNMPHFSIKNKNPFSLFERIGSLSEAFLHNKGCSNDR